MSGNMFPNFVRPEGGSPPQCTVEGLPASGQGGQTLGHRENQLLPVQYTLIGHSAQALELFVHIGGEITEGGDFQLLFVVHWVC